VSTEKDSPKIPIRNIYYMLCYAWNTLSKTDDVQVGSDKFDNIYNLLARILYGGIKQLQKRGFHREYKLETEELSGIRGKIDFSMTVKQNSLIRKKLACNFDEFTADVTFNQILKYTIGVLLRCPMVDTEYKRNFKKTLPNFAEIGALAPTQDVRSKLLYNRNNKHYVLLMNICELIYEGLIADEEGEELKFSDFIRDREMARLYEKFVLNFYKKHLPVSYQVHSPKIPWDLSHQYDNDQLRFLPEMKTDIVVVNKTTKTQLIIDTKYYPSALTKSFRSETKKLISNNLYQIYTYMGNSSYPGRIMGLLLYPTTTEELNLSFPVGGKYILVKTLDLNQEWVKIENRLLEVASISELIEGL